MKTTDKNTTAGRPRAEAATAGKPVADARAELDAASKAIANAGPTLPIFIGNDQPPTCPQCGRRVDCTDAQSQRIACACGFAYTLEQEEEA